VLLGAEPVGMGTQPRWGERAEHIRLLHDRYPAMPPSVIADKVGCDPSNVTRVISRYVKAVSLEELQDFQGSKADIYDAIQHKALASVTEESMSKCNGLQLVTMAAILEDKSRLVRGQPTSIHVHALVDVLEALRQREGE
jgi:hypothetical protein